jgi:hypothetical protein
VIAPFSFALFIKSVFIGEYTISYTIVFELIPSSEIILGSFFNPTDVAFTITS